MLRMIEGGSTESTSSGASGGTLKLDRRSRGIRDSVAESEHPSEKHEVRSISQSSNFRSPRLIQKTTSFRKALAIFQYPLSKLALSVSQQYGVQFPSLKIVSPSQTAGCSHVYDKPCIAGCRPTVHRESGEQVAGLGCLPESCKSCRRMTLSELRGFLPIVR